MSEIQGFLSQAGLFSLFRPLFPLFHSRLFPSVRLTTQRYLLLSIDVYVRGKHKECIFGADVNVPGYPQVVRTCVRRDVRHNWRRNLPSDFTRCVLIHAWHRNGQQDSRRIKILTSYILVQKLVRNSTLRNKVNIKFSELLGQVHFEKICTICLSRKYQKERDIKWRVCHSIRW